MSNGDRHVHPPAGLASTGAPRQAVQPCASWTARWASCRVGRWPSKRSERSIPLPAASSWVTFFLEHYLYRSPVDTQWTRCRL